MPWHGSLIMSQRLEFVLAPLLQAYRQQLGDRQRGRREGAPTAAQLDRRFGRREKLAQIAEDHDREIGATPDSIDLILFRAVDIGHEENRAGIAVQPCFKRSRPQSANELCRQHAYADLFNNVPDAAETIFLVHIK